MVLYMSQEVSKLQTGGGSKMEVYYYLLALILHCSLGTHRRVAQESNKT